MEKVNERWSTCGAADAAVGLCGPAAAAVTLIIHSHLQTVFEPHRLDGEALVSAARRAAPRLHAHVERYLQKQTEGSGVIRKGNVPILALMEKG